MKRGSKGIIRSAGLGVRDTRFHPCFAINARQPLKAEISRAPAMSAASTIKPLTARPSASRTVPIESGGGIAANEFSEARCGERPNLERDRGSRSRLDAQHAGFCWRGVERVEIVIRCGRGCLQQASAERLNSPLSAMPERCAPTTAMAISSPLVRAGNCASGGWARPLLPKVNFVSAWKTRPMLATARRARRCHKA